MFPFHSYGERLDQNRPRHSFSVAFDQLCHFQSGYPSDLTTHAEKDKQTVVRAWLVVRSRTLTSDRVRESYGPQEGGEQNRVRVPKMTLFYLEQNGLPRDA